MVCWDLGGQRGLRGIWDKYFKEAQALIFVIDATDASRVEELRNVFGMYLGTMNDDDDDNMAMMVMM